MSDLNPTQSALAAIQEILKIVAKHVRSSINYPIENTKTIGKAKELVNWKDSPSIAPLQSIFDAVKLDLDRSSEETHYIPLQSIADTDPPIPYPVTSKPDTTEYFTEIRKAIESISPDDWQNLSFLSIFLEKYGSCLSFGEENIALNDFARSAAGVAAALAQAKGANLKIEDTDLRLIAGDLSGIQKFIYTISSDGALKSLRARSFFLELVTIEIAHRLIESLQLTQSNIIYAGGGNIYILAAATPNGKDTIEQVRNSINDWFIHEYQGEIFLALDSIDFPQGNIRDQNLAKHWATVTQNLAKQKGRKFDNQNQLVKLLAVKSSHEPCKVCHRDDEANLEPLKGDSTVMACGTCRRILRLGAQIFRTRLVVRSRRMELSEKFIKIGRGKDEVFYYLFGDDRSEESDLDRYILEAQADPVWLINNWNLEHHRSPNTRLLLLGNYGQRGENGAELDEEEKIQGGRFITAEELAEKAAGIDRVGYLRMDVDRLGLIFAKGLDTQHNLPRLAGLSRQMSYFFKVYLNSLASDREKNLLENATKLTDRELKDLVFIYTGGDDLFIAGAWNQIAEFACDIYQSFCAYTGGNPDITISGGIAINTSKYPLYRSAAEAGVAEHQAKANDKDSLTLFGETFKWSQWLSKPKSYQDDEYLNGEQPIEMNIIEIVAKLNNPDEIGYARAFIRNLLILADIRDRKIKELGKDPDTDLKNALTYYLHLPQLAYALSRLPPSVRNKDEFTPIRQALMNPRTSPYFRAIATWVELLNRE